MSPRLIVTRVIQRVVEDKVNLSIIFNNSDLITPNLKEKSLIQEMCYGTLRWYFDLEVILDELIEKPIRKKDRALKYLLLIGLYQIKHMNIATHAIVSETVETCSELDKKWAKGFVNAILRKYLKDKKNHDFNSDLHAHPEWLMKQIKTDWPNQWEQILDENNHRPPMFLRINKLKTNRNDYLRELVKVNLIAEKTLHSNQGILLSNPVNVNELPNFENGYVSVQELAAQLAINLLDLNKGHSVLDACAAPGGKSAHILESCPEIHSLTLIEKDKHRAEKITSTLKRLGLDGNIHIADARELDLWWDKKLFDRILLDAPCSATGVIRRHPDIKVLRQPEDIKANSELQLELLYKLWETLKVGGLFLYVTCSILKQENMCVIKRFIKKQKDCVIKPISTDWGIETNYGRQILTGEDNMDGFFYCLMYKT